MQRVENISKPIESKIISLDFDSAFDNNNKTMHRFKIIGYFANISSYRHVYGCYDALMCIRRNDVGRNQFIDLAVVELSVLYQHVCAFDRSNPYCLSLKQMDSSLIDFEQIVDEPRVLHTVESCRSLNRKKARLMSINETASL